MRFSNLDLVVLGYSVLTGAALGACGVAAPETDGTSAVQSALENDEADDERCELPESEGGRQLTAAVYGDAPYGTSPTDTAQFDATPAFINAVNADSAVSLVLHVGDIHSGKQYCTEAYDRGVFQLWQSFADPLVYTPGDNEWTDCHKSAEGGGAYNAATGSIKYVLDANGNPVDYAQGNPKANLELVRTIFFSRPGFSLGGHPKHVLSQAQCYDTSFPADAKFVENVMWRQAGVLFVTLNVPGGSNNDTDIWYGSPTLSAEQSQEIAERTAADLRWLDVAFERASHGNSTKGVVLILQADMWDPEKGAAHQAAYEPYVQSIAAKTLAYGKPVLMFNGDSHVYQSSNPLSSSDPLAYMHPGYDVPNFHRIVVHGSTLPLEYLRFTVNPKANNPHTGDAFGPFSWVREMH
ncbi:MAG TPA: hypothetical protein VHM70_29780 [Polyangiaceae bacterium]|jgi:hypothetical protein|nr:hypothetical protein [Polyangiaceae bacterium]